MKRNPTICLLLALAMALSFAACGSVPAQPAASEEPTVPEVIPGTVTPEPEAEPIHQTDPKMQAIFNALPSVQQDSSREWRYAVTDLDHNGMPELLAAAQHQADRSTTLKAWELGENLDALYECAVALEEDESFPDILSDNADTYHNTTSDTWSYLFYDDILLSESDGYTAKCAVTLRDRVLRYEAFAFQYVTVRNGGRTVEHMDLNGAQISAEEYNAAGQAAFAGAEMSSSNFGWFRYEDAVDPSVLENSYAVFTGEQTPDKSNPLPQPQPLAAVDPNAAPAPGAAPLFLYITKNPTNEKHAEGETAYFVAFANVYTSLSWTFVSPDGGEYSPQSFANKFSGVELGGIYSTTLSISKLSKQADRWGVYCTFNYEGQTARTNTAYLSVAEKTNPSPSPAPTATPAPTAAPTAEPTEAPAPTVEPTAAPAPTEGPSPVPPEGETMGKGGFSSETGTGLDLCCDWVATRVGEHQAVVTLSISIRSATISLNRLANGLHIELGKDIVELPQPAVDYKGGKTTTYLGGKNFTVDLAEGTNELPLTVVWYFKGSYGGQKMPEISCGGTISITEEPAPQPEPEPEPVYASMAGVVRSVDETQYLIELADGLTVAVEPAVCRLAYGVLAEGCSCTVYYADTPSTENIYLVDIYGEPEEDEPEPEDETLPMVGSYVEKKDKNFEISIKASDDPKKGDYLVTVTRKNEAGEKTKWVFYGSFDEEGKLSYTNCVKTSDNKNETKYSDGRGTLSYDKETKRLTWKDEKENVGKDLAFEKK